MYLLIYNLRKFFIWFFDLFAERFNGYILKYSRCNRRRRAREREEKYKEKLARKGLRLVK